MTSVVIVAAGQGDVRGLVPPGRQSQTTAVVAGPREAAEAAALSGVAKVIWVQTGPGQAIEAAAGAVAGAVAALEPKLVVASVQPSDRVLAGAVAARLRAPVLTMVSQIELSPTGIKATRQVFGGIAQVGLEIAGPAVMVSDPFPSEVWPTPPPTPVEIEPATPPAGTGIEVVELRRSETTAVDLTKAKRIVAIGRGLKQVEDLAMINQLATALGAAVACSRPLAEGQGWFSHDAYIGVTGQTVAPELYVAIGISGQLQHVVGARGAGTVVVINQDDKCPYFAEADVSVLGDLYQVVPALTKVLA